ncbi:MAG: DoxX family protein [Chitinophagaceae bacterium]
MLYTKTAFLVARLAIGSSMLAHGLVRLPQLDKFSNWMITEFEKSMLPQALVRAFSYVLPFAELLAGILLMAGLFTRFGLLLGSAVMIVLIFGSGMIEDWSAIPSQLIHAAFFAALLAGIEYNYYAADNLLRKKESSL